MRSTVSTLVLTAALGCEAARSPAPVVAPETVSWALEHEESSGVVVSVWGSGPSDVWAAGGQADRGLILHNAGHGWVPVEVDAGSLIWNIYGTAPDNIYAVGERGLILHYDGAVWSRVPSGTTKTLYGVWASPGRDAWIVGGNPTGSPGDAVILRGTPAGFEEVGDLPRTELPDTLFKIYGSDEPGLIAVGRDGTVLRHDGETWRREAVPTTTPLISLWGRSATDVYAVGGHASGVMLHFDGKRWSSVEDVEYGPQLFGVFTAPGEPVFAVGADTEIVELLPGGATAAYTAPGLDGASVLHSVWGDGAGNVYAVGGSLMRYPAAMTGVILRRSVTAAQEGSAP